MLNTTQARLYQRLQAFELDDPTHEFGFTRHLMKNHGWTWNYAQRAIAEYKKFAFLTVEANHQIVPSDQVDQVWHAHVLLTQSYWEEFCPKILGQKLHHHPARGGRAERAEFHDLYRQTMVSYRHFFGAPPTDIWSPPHIRFGKELKMQRVSLSDHWLLPKQWPQWRLPSPIAMVIVALITMGWIGTAHGSMPPGHGIPPGAVNQFWLTIGGPAMVGFLIRYVIIQPIQRPREPQLDIYETAYLVGKDSRAVELAIAQLVHQGYLHCNVTHRTLRIAKPLPPQAPKLEQQVMQHVQKTPDFQSLRQTYKYNTHSLKERLAQEELVMTDGSAFMGESFYLFLFVTVLGRVLISLLDIPLSHRLV